MMAFYFLLIPTLANDVNFVHLQQVIFLFLPRLVGGLTWFQFIDHYDIKTPA